MLKRDATSAGAHRPAAARIRIGDMLVVSLYIAGSVALLVWQTFHGDVPLAALLPDVLSLAVGVVALALRRAPLAMALPAAVVALAAAVPLQQPTDMYVFAATVYAVTAWGGIKQGAGAWTALTVVAVANATWLRLMVSDPPRIGRWQIDLLLCIGVGVAALLIGVAVNARRRYVASLLLLTEQLAAERDLTAQLAARAERARMARDVHDILSHGLQVMVSAADAASAVLPREPERTRALLEDISATGRRSMGEARTVFALLRDPDAPDEATPQPDLAQLPALIEQSRAAGLVVDVTHRGTPSLDATRQLVAHRIVQEALTNVLRHAGAGAHVAVTITHSRVDTALTIVDDGPVEGRPAADRARGSGSGLAGMRERVHIVGGEYNAGPRADAPGWRVQAIVPTTSPMPSEDEG